MQEGPSSSASPWAPQQQQQLQQWWISQGLAHPLVQQQLQQQQLQQQPLVDLISGECAEEIERCAHILAEAITVCGEPLPSATESFLRESSLREKAACPLSKSLLSKSLVSVM